MFSHPPPHILILHYSQSLDYVAPNFEVSAPRRAARCLFQFPLPTRYTGMPRFNPQNTPSPHKSSYTPVQVFFHRTTGSCWGKSLHVLRCALVSHASLSTRTFRSTHTLFHTRAYTNIHNCLGHILKQLEPKAVEEGVLQEYWVPWTVRMRHAGVKRMRQFLHHRSHHQHRVHSPALCYLEDNHTAVAVCVCIPRGKLVV